MNNALQYWNMRTEDLLKKWAEKHKWKFLLQNNQHGVGLTVNDKYCHQLIYHNEDPSLIVFNRLVDFLQKLEAKENE